MSAVYGLSILGVDRMAISLGLMPTECWTDAHTRLVVPDYYATEDAIEDDATIGIFDAVDGRVGATWWTGDGWALVWQDAPAEFSYVGEWGDCLHGYAGGELWAPDWSYARVAREYRECAIPDADSADLVAWYASTGAEWRPKT